MQKMILTKEFYALSNKKVKRNFTHVSLLIKNYIAIVSDNSPSILLQTYLLSLHNKLPKTYLAMAY